VTKSIDYPIESKCKLIYPINPFEPVTSHQSLRRGIRRSDEWM